jgi:hypothetical protein
MVDLPRLAAPCAAFNQLVIFQTPAARKLARPLYKAIHPG